MLKAGPVWDFDWTTYRMSMVTTYIARRGLYYPQLFEDPVFVSKVKERWIKFKPLFDEIADVITKEGERLTRSVELDDEMWELKNYENYNEDNMLSYIEAVDKMRTFYLNRLSWLDMQIMNMR